MTDEVPAKKVDEDWKRRVAQEKSMPTAGPGIPAGRPAAGSAAPGHRPGEPRAARQPAGRSRDPGPSDRAPTAHFLQFVQALAAQALVALGQIENPVTGQFEQDLQQARGTIETLLMLQDKTRGNLTPEENQILSQLVQELQMAYVQLAS